MKKTGKIRSRLQAKSSETSKRMVVQKTQEDPYCIEADTNLLLMVLVLEVRVLCIAL
jgi:hypothetical protein